MIATADIEDCTDTNTKIDMITHHTKILNTLLDDLFDQMQAFKLQRYDGSSDDEGDTLSSVDHSISRAVSVTSRGSHTKTPMGPDSTNSRSRNSSAKGGRGGMIRSSSNSSIRGSPSLEPKKK
jgi:hypothetical protein